MHEGSLGHVNTKWNMRDGSHGIVNAVLDVHEEGSQGIVNAERDIHEESHGACIYGEEYT